jgi:hypothetical protein
MRLGTKELTGKESSVLPKNVMMSAVKNLSHTNGAL